MTLIARLADLRGRTAVITGATGHLGAVISLTLAELGADVALIDQPGTDFAPLRSDIEGVSQSAIYEMVCDLESQDARTLVAREIRERVGKIDILVNNAAFVGTTKISGWAEPFPQQTIEAWRRAVEVNMTAPFHLAQQLSSSLRKSSCASIINIGSIYGCVGPDYSLYEDTHLTNPAAYGASKGGLIQLTRWLATTLAPDVRVNAITPGGIFRNQPPSFVARYAQRTPLGRMATEADFVGAITFLATDMSRYVTGQNLCVDGGWTAW